MKKLFKIAFIAFISMCAIPAMGQGDFEQMLDMELEDLMNIDIYSVSKKSESLLTFNAETRRSWE